MKKLFQFMLLMFAFTALSSNTTFAQKYGHLNSGNLLSQMPEVTKADEALATYQEKLGEAFKVKVDAFQKKYNDLVQQVNTGTMSQVQIQTEENALREEQAALAKEEQDNVAKVQQKRQELLQPLLDNVDKAIKEVGKENGYSMIFETSIINTILFAEDADDVMPLVKKKLGIQ
ncbi:MAG: OmpH family outer membrane protein [Bacteroidota bacterium]